MKFVVGFTLIMLSAPVIAQSQAELVRPDRPDFSAGTSIVAVGKIQLEGGALLRRRDGERQITLGEWQLRVPFSPNAELRIGAPSYLLRRDDERQSGFDDLMLETKIKVADAGKNLSFGLLLNALVPTGSHAVAEHRYQPGATLLLDATLSRKWSLLGNLGTVRASNQGQRFDQTISSASLRYDPSARSRIFAEYFALSRIEPGGAAQRTLGAGGYYLINDKTALDLRVGVGLDGDSDYFVGVGFSRLF